MAVIKGTSGGDFIGGQNTDDTVYGYGGNDALFGSGGRDVLYGGAGNDSLYGGTGADTLYGGAGNDDLFGGDGADLLFGGVGVDRFTGGAGADRFAFASVNDYANPGYDVITDFSRAQGDRIDLSRIDANWNVAGDQAFRFIGDNAFSGRAGEASITLRTSNGEPVTIVSVDTNGDRSADFRVQIDGHINLTAGDFIL